MDWATFPRSRTTWPLASAVETLRAASSAFTATTTLNHHHRHVDNGHDDEGDDSKVDEASRSFTVLEFRRHLEAAAVPRLALTFVVVEAVVVTVVVAVKADDAAGNV